MEFMNPEKLIVLNQGQQFRTWFYCTRVFGEQKRGGIHRIQRYVPTKKGYIPYDGREEVDLTYRSGRFALANLIAEAEEFCQRRGMQGSILIVPEDQRLLCDRVNEEFEQGRDIDLVDTTYVIAKIDRATRKIDLFFREEKEIMPYRTGIDINGWQNIPQNLADTMYEVQQMVTKGTATIEEIKEKISATNL